VLWSCLEKKDVPFNYTQVIGNLHERAKTRVSTLGAYISDFLVDIGLHQKTGFKPFCT